MDAYDTAVLSYALATAASKYKPSLLGLPPNISNLPHNLGTSRGEDISLTPPTRQQEINEEIDLRNSFYQLLCSVEEHLINKTPIHFQQLLKMCAMRLSDTQTVALLDTLQSEIIHLGKQNSATSHLLLLEGDNQRSLKTEAICTLLMELCVKYGLIEGANILKTHLTYNLS